MPIYYHSYDFAVSVRSINPTIDNITPAMLRDALLERIGNLSDAELDEACLYYDTYEKQPSGADADA